MKKIFILSYISLLVFTTVIVPVFAAEDQIRLGDKQPAGMGIKAVGNPNASIGNIVSNFVRIMYIAGGLAVLVFLLWGAFDWITSGGDKEKIAGARRKIINALIGMALLALSAFIVTLSGQIVGFDPLNTGSLPKLDDPIK